MKLISAEMLVAEEGSAGTIMVTVSDGYMVIAQGASTIRVDEVDALAFSSRLVDFARKNAIVPEPDILEEDIKNGGLL